MNFLYQNLSVLNYFNLQIISSMSEQEFSLWIKTFFVEKNYF